MVLGDTVHTGGKNHMTDNFAGNKIELLQVSSDQKTKEKQLSFL